VTNVCVPYDPPEWSLERRDDPMTKPLDEERLAATRTQDRVTVAPRVARPKYRRSPAILQNVLLGA